MYWLLGTKRNWNQSNTSEISFLSSVSKLTASLITATLPCWSNSSRVLHSTLLLLQSSGPFSSLPLNLRLNFKQKCYGMHWGKKLIKQEWKKVRFLTVSRLYIFLYPPQPQRNNWLTGTGTPTDLSQQESGIKQVHIMSFTRHNTKL